MSESAICPSCGSNNTWIFYEQRQVPVQSILLLHSREEALALPKGDIRLAFCQSCGFITNTTFDPGLVFYSEQCEETQGFSPIFNAFHRRLAEQLIHRYHLHNKTIIEIGCGKGEFLALLCEMGSNWGIGFDPTYVDGRIQSPAQDRMTFIQDYYSEKYSEYPGDFYCCKMTLEHILDTADFIGMVRHSIGDQPGATVFFQVPDVVRILRERAFWDIYYEHCSYFSLGSLARLFRSCNFDVIDLWRDYDNQYLMIEARPGDGSCISRLPQEDDLEVLARDIIHFSRNYPRKLESWRQRLLQLKGSRSRMVLWGAGSKAVSFLTTLDIHDEIAFVVDINPYKQGTYISGTGQEIVPPGFLKEYRPEIVILMNPVYQKEIQQDLDRLGVDAEVIGL